jgi:quercetin dioxygenase-like cupin family protein
MAQVAQKYDPSYFVATDEGQAPVEPGRFVRFDEVKTFSLVEGATFRPILGTNMLINYITVEPNSPNVPHSHAEEQIFFLIEGEMEFTLGEETRTITAGQFVVIPPWVNHGGGTKDKHARGIDVFNPPRRQLRELIEQ